MCRSSVTNEVPLALNGSFLRKRRRVIKTQLCIDYWARKCHKFLPLSLQTQGFITNVLWRWLCVQIIHHARKHQTLDCSFNRRFNFHCDNLETWKWTFMIHIEMMTCQLKKMMKLSSLLKNKKRLCISKELFKWKIYLCQNVSSRYTTPHA